MAVIGYSLALVLGVGLVVYTLTRVVVAYPSPIVATVGAVLGSALALWSWITWPDLVSDGTPLENATATLVGPLYLLIKLAAIVLGVIGGYRVAKSV